MCTLITFDMKTYEKDMKAIDAHIMSDVISNPHGISMLVASKRGDYSMVKTKNVDALIAFMCFEDFHRVWIHTRFSTGGDPILANMHGWNTGSVYVMHNGHIKNPEADRFAVDSKVIVHWLAKHGYKGCLERLKPETFANVFMIDAKNGKYAVKRSVSGSLYTDGNGNFSSHAIKAVGIDQPVRQSVQLFDSVREFVKPAFTGWEGYDHIPLNSYRNYTPRQETHENWSKALSTYVQRNKGGKVS